jgi:hypothetical protein
MKCDEMGLTIFGIRENYSGDYIGEEVSSFPQ